MLRNLRFPLLACISLYGTTNAAILLTIDISNINAVTFAATSNNASSDSSLSASANGFTVEEFFIGSPSVSYIIGNVTGTLTPVTGTAATYVAAGTFDFSDGTEDFKPANDLNFTAGGSTGAGSQVFTTGSPAFAGVAAMDLGSFAANLPSVGSSGNIYPGFSQGVQPIGEWTVVPEPSIYMIPFLALSFVFSRRKSRI